MRPLGVGGRRVMAELVGVSDPGGRGESRLEPATVTAVTAGGASDGNAACQVSWRGVTVTVAYLASYTPVVGHVVLLNVQPPSLVAIGRVIGTP